MYRTLKISLSLALALVAEAHATVANVPEPSVWALLAGGVAAGIIIKRMLGGD